MQAVRFEYRIMPKKFEQATPNRTLEVHPPGAAVLKTSPRLKRRLNRLKKSLADRVAASRIVNNYLNGPIGVKGQKCDDANELQRQKARYHSNFSCSQTSLVATTVITSGAHAHAQNSTDSKLQVPRDAGVKQYLEYTGPRPSLASDRGSFLPGYTDEFFDFLDLPGHFNTRGIYGQKAQVTTTKDMMTRSKSDLHLNNLSTVFRENGRHKTTLSRFGDGFATHRHTFKDDLHLPRLVKQKKCVQTLESHLNNSRKQNESTKKTKKKPLTIKIEECKDSARAAKADNVTPSVNDETKLSVNDATSGVNTGNGGKRLSVDASTQTDGDYHSDDDDGFMSETSDSGSHEYGIF